MRGTLPYRPTKARRDACTAKELDRAGGTPCRQWSRKRRGCGSPLPAFPSAGRVGTIVFIPATAARHPSGEGWQPPSVNKSQVAFVECGGG